MNGTTDPRDGSVDHLSLNSLKDRHGPIRAPKSRCAPYWIEKANSLLLLVLKDGPRREYDVCLRNRGSLTIWFTPDAIAGWKAQPRTTPGGQRHYSNLAIETALTLRAVFRLALRQSAGLIGSIMRMLEIDLPVPDVEPAGVWIAGSNAPEKRDRRSSLDRR